MVASKIRLTVSDAPLGTGKGFKLPFIDAFPEALSLARLCFRDSRPNFSFLPRRFARSSVSVGYNNVSKHRSHANAKYVENPNSSRSGNCTNFGRLPRVYRSLEGIRLKAYIPAAATSALTPTTTTIFCSRMAATSAYVGYRVTLFHGMW